MNWTDLSQKEKEWYKEKTSFLSSRLIHVESGEPLFFDNSANLIPLEVIYNYLKKIERKEKLERLNEI